ncbi:MAG: hypothetical protein DCF25_01925, partial [Leptolyngbya foveolarum]
MASLDTTSNRSPFLVQNQSEFAELLTFIDFAQGLTLGFIEVNQAQNQALLIDALKATLVDTDVHLEVINFSLKKDLRDLREAVMQRMGSMPDDRKLVLLLLGLEAAIGTDGMGEYPPILQDLNFMRDAYRRSVPHPLLFVLPDYAITRVSKFAPDFWAWKSGLFRFVASEAGLEKLKDEILEQPSGWIASDKNQAQIEQLKQLLMELNPSGKQIALKDVPLCADIYYKIGSAYLTQQRPNRAEEYLEEGLKLVGQHPNSVLQQSLQRKLGNAYEQMRRFDDAVCVYEVALAQAQLLEQPEKVSALLADLGDVALRQREFDRAKGFYQQALDICIEFNDRYTQATVYHQLGYVAQELRDFEQARSHFQQALDIQIEFNDRYAQASTYHQLGRVAQELRDFEQARSHFQQALDIKIEFNDRYAQAKTYHQLGIVAQELRDFEQARSHFQQA